MFITNLKEKANAMIHAISMFVGMCMKRFVLGSVLVAGIVGGTTYVVVTVAMPHMPNIVNLAKLNRGEARGESWRGQKAVFGTILARVSGKYFPNTVQKVVYQPYPNNSKLLQYNAMGDEIPEDLTTEVGQKILWRTAWWYVQNEVGIFRAPSEARGAHSYCTPAACERQKGYFGTLKLIGQIGGHVFYGDCDCTQVRAAEVKTTAPTTSLRPKARPTRPTGSTLAPKKSLRPKMRPKQSTVRRDVADQPTDQHNAVDQALALVMEG